MLKRWITDLALTAILLPLMGYSLIGEAVHEWLGLAMLALIVLHHIWNHVWYKGLDKGRMSIYRAAQTLLTFLLLLSVIGSLFSGLVLSQYILDFLPLGWGQDWASTLHLPCAFWSFLLMGLHLGLHWSGVMGQIRRIAGLSGPSRARTAILRLMALPLRAAACWPSSRSGFSDYLLLRTHFLFFPPGQTAARFLADYFAIFGLFVWIGHYGGKRPAALFRQKEGVPMIQHLIPISALALVLLLSGCGAQTPMPGSQEPEGATTVETHLQSIPPSRR